MGIARNLARVIADNSGAIAAGNLGNAVPANGSITIAKLASSVTSKLSLKNLLLNGDFRIWQKGTDLNPATTGSAITTVDRWTTQYADFSPRIRKVEDTLPNGEVVDCVEITKLSGTYSSCELTQKVEVNTSKYLRGQTVTFSFWLRKYGSTFGSHQTFGSHHFDAWIGDSETADDTGWTNSRTADRGRATKISPSPTSLPNNTWVKYSITRTLSSDTNTIYCTIYTQNTPVNEGIRVAKCQLEVGSVSTEFENRPLAMELLMCQRFFCVLNESLIGRTESNGVATLVSQYPTTMRTSPTAARDGLVLRIPGIQDYSINNILTNSAQTNGILISFSASTSFNSPQVIMGCPGTTGLGLLLNAEF
jgi:hypothetical protein